MYGINYANIKNNSDDLCTFPSLYGECISQVFFIVLEKFIEKFNILWLLLFRVCVKKD